MNELYLIIIFLIFSLVPTLHYLNKNKILKKHISELSKYQYILDLDKYVENLNKEQKSTLANIEDNKQKIIMLLEKQKNMEETISLLEDHNNVLEFGIYTPKFNYEVSEKYKEELTIISTKIKNIIKENEAAKCDAKWEIGGSTKNGEKMIKDTLKLMLRAFNGESDACIAKVNYNNIKTMEQRIIKSFEVLNKLGKTKYCYITSTYLELRLQELYLTYERIEKIIQEKEEQKIIKEQMREEEKLQRELEKAQIEAQIEEQKYEKAIEKAKKELQNASGEQLDKLHSQILLLQQQLEEAHKNKERAISRAQMTKSGHVYIISNIGSFGEDIYKIGMTRRLEPLDRISELSNASVPFDFDIHAMIYSENAPELERLLHKQFQDYRVNKINERREFFNVNILEIEKVVRKNHSNIKFTKIAEAVQYRKSLAIILENTNTSGLDKLSDNLQNKKYAAEKKALLAI